MLLIGIINPTGVTPSFVIPLFQEPDSHVFYIQRLDESERIKSFDSIHLPDAAKNNSRWLDTEKRRQAGTQRLYGFQFQNNDFIVGTKPELRKTLIERLNEVRGRTGNEHPFVLISIAEFVGDFSLRTSAEARAYALLNNESPTARERWRNILESTTNPLGIPPTKQGYSSEAENAFREANRRDSTRVSVIADMPNVNSLANDVEIKGSIKFENELTFAGIIEGAIISNDGILTVEENASIQGEVKAKAVIVMGRVNGNITVQERCELRSRSQLIGDLRAARLVIEEGATFVGKSEVSPNKAILKQSEAKESVHFSHH